MRRALAEADGRADGRVDDPTVDLAGLAAGERKVLAAALSDIQVRSKLWLLERLLAAVRLDGATVLVLGGWCGVLPWLAAATGCGGARWLSIDIDGAVTSLGRRAFGAVPGLSFVHGDVYDLDYDRFAGAPLVIVNTICEHLHDFGAWRAGLPAGVPTVLQSNDYRGCPDHVNCVDSSRDLAAAADFRELLFEGALPLSLFTRYMVIGRP